MKAWKGIFNGTNLKIYSKISVHIPEVDNLNWLWADLRNTARLQTSRSDSWFICLPPSPQQSDGLSGRKKRPFLNQLCFIFIWMKTNVT